MSDTNKRALLARRLAELGTDGRCVCSCIDRCPIERHGSEDRCTKAELEEAQRAEATPAEPSTISAPKHVLKSWIGLFDPIAAGHKPYDLRVLDRDYRIGDICLLREYDPLKRIYTGREVTVEITWITSSSGQETHQACAFSPIALHPASGILGYKLLSVS